MIHLKTYENWFTNIFKSGENMWDDWQSDYMGNQFKNGYNALMSAAFDGNWKRFKNLLSDNRYDVNAINIDRLDNGDESRSNVLFSAINGEGGLWEKKKMISALIEKGIDVYFQNENNETFYDIIKDPKLKKWFDETYPDIIVQLDAKKYNI